MPELDANNLPQSPAINAVETIRAHMASATGIRGLLNRSVKIGVDAILSDAIEGKLLEDTLPCIRIGYRTAGYTLASNAGVALYKTVNLSLFFLYSTGRKGGSVLGSQFSQLRDRHIRWNLEWLKDVIVKPNNTIGMTQAQHQDDAGSVYWWWPNGEQEIAQEDETPFDVFGVNVPINPSSGMACTRVDLQILVKNHATFNNDWVPPMSQNFTSQGFTGDGSTTAYTLTQLPDGRQLIVSLNGLIQGSGDFSRSVKIITFSTAPSVGDNIQVFYSY